MGIGVKGFGGSGSGNGPKLQGLSALPPAAVAAKEIFGPAPEVTLVGDNIVNTSSGNLAFPGGTAAGDLAVVLFVIGSATPTSIGDGWTLQDSAAGVLTGSSYSIYSKTLLQADIDTPVAFSTSNGGYNLVVYRNHAAITFKQAANTISVSGFTKAVDSARLLTFYVDRDALTSTVPTGFTEINNQNIAFFNMASGDILSENYTDNTSITWATGGVGLGQGEAMSVLEITI